jgi:hypothetical protein
MLTISGSDWFSRRGGACRLHAIMNQACIYMRKVGEAVKDGWQPIAAEAQTLRMAQVDFRFLLPEEVDALMDEAGSLYDRIIGA